MANQEARMSNGAAASVVPARRKTNEVLIAQAMDSEKQLNYARLSDSLATQGEITLYISGKLYLGAGQQTHLKKMAATFKLKSVKDAQRVMAGFEKWAKEMGAGI